jgi:murein L,D-transpeptidase YafK
VAHPPPAPRVVIRKTARTLSFYSGSRLVKEYRVGLGGSPEGDKERQGDSRTPTGDLYVCTRLRQSRFHRFLGLSYPDPQDAARGLKGGLITRGEYRAILSAHRQRRQPPWETRLGGAIGIHGGGAEADWTLGCIAVENSEIEELFAVLPLGTPVRILP